MDLETAIRKAQGGDVEAYGEIVREFQARLRAFSAAFCPRKDLVDDIAQRAFVWAFQHIRDYRPGTHFYLWLKAIARNILLAELEVLRREARNRHRYLEYLQARSSSSGLGQDPDGNAPELLDALRRCIEQLSPRAQRMIRQRYEGRDPLPAIAALQGTTTSTVKVTLFRIRQTLRRCIERSGARAIE